MPEQVIMPRLSDTMTEGTVSKWLKHPGDKVKKGEPLVEIETDKANIELEAYASGTLARIILIEGQSAPVGNLIGEIALPGEPLESAALATPSAAATATAATAATAASVAPVAAVAPQASVPATLAAPAPRQAGVPAHQAGRLRASPMARRLARELGVNLSAVRGTGPLGRIQKDDVESSAVAKPMARATAPAPTTADDVELVPLSRMQQTIVRRMVESKATIPHFYVSMEVDMQAAVDVLDGLNDGLAKDERMTINDLILKACALTLKAFPEVNSFYADGQLYRHKRINVGFAVAIPNGLVVPVVRDVDQKNLRQISLDTKALVKKTRDGKIEPADYEGGTFSVSNLGMYGVDEFTAIINPPQSAILAVGAVQEKPVVRDGQIVISKRVMLTLSADHRVFYGFTGAEYLRDLKQRLEKPLSIIL